MNKNNITAIVLMILVVFGFSYWSSHNNKKTQQAATETTAQSSQTATVAKQTALPADTNALFAAALSASDSVAFPIVLKNDKLEVTISPKGGQVSRVVLKDFKSYADYKAGKDQALVLYSSDDASFNLNFDTKSESISTSDLYFTPENASSRAVSMVVNGKNGERIAIDYSLTDDYMLNMSVRTAGLQQQFSRNTKTFGVKWQDNVRQYEKGYYFENMYSTLTYKDSDGDSDHLKEQGDKQEKVERPVEWVAFKNQYFSAVLIAKEAFTAADFNSRQLAEHSGYLKGFSADLEAPFDPSGKTPAQFQWYFGPNNFRLLQSMEKHALTPDNDLDLQKLVYLGWPVVRWINRFFTIYVFDFLTSLNLPMWLVLVIITLILRAIVYVPTKKSFLSSAKTRVLRPKVEAINAKYPNKEDALKRQQETMALYSQYGSSPLGGCLPMLIQMPIWIAMFNFVPNAIELRQQSFLWADDLSAYDDLISWGTNIWGLGNHLSLFCVLFCLANLLYSYMSMRQQRDSMAASPDQAANMKVLQYSMFLMPVMFFFMFNKYSAGLNFYYFISLFSSAATMWYLRRTTDDAKLLAKLEAYYEKNKNNPQKKTSGLAARLQALNEQQQKMLEEQRRRNGQNN